MPIPGQTLTIRDPGLGVVGQSDNVFVFVGTAEKGDLNVVKAFGSPRTVLDTYGQGELSEDLCHTLLIAGGPVYGCRVAGSIAGTNGSVTKTAVGSSTGTVAVSGAPFARYMVSVEITLSGTLGAGRFKYTLDSNRGIGATYSQEITIPGGGTYAIPYTNLSLVFTPGGGPVYFERGDTHAFTSMAPHYGTTEVGLAMDALSSYMSTAPNALFDAIVLTGRNETGAAAATLFGALDTRLTGFEQKFRYLGAIMDAGSGDTRANVKSAMAAVASRRICAVYGDCDVASAKTFPGYGAPRRTALSPVAARAAASLISTDLGRVASGPLSGVLAITHDEDELQEMEDAQISTLRKHPNSTGYFITNAWMKSPVGSDFRYWQHRRVMDVACRTVVKAQQQFISMNLPTIDGGTLDPAEAKRLEAIVKPQLAAVLSEPKDIEGRAGHVSDFAYSIDLENNVLLTETVQSEVGIRPYGYAKLIVTQIGYTTSLSG